MEPIPDFKPDFTWRQAKQMERERDAAQREQSRAIREGETFGWARMLYLNLKRVYRGWPFQLRRKPLPERI